MLVRALLLRWIEKLVGRHVGSIIDAMIDISSRFKSTTVSTFVSRSCVSAESMGFMTASRMLLGDLTAVWGPGVQSPGRLEIENSNPGVKRKRTHV